MNTLEEGEKLIRQGQWVLERELRVALEEGNFNLAVRRAQEVVELVLIRRAADVGSRLSESA